MSLVGGPSPFARGGAYRVIEDASTKADARLEAGEIGTKVKPAAARLLDAAVKLGMHHELQQEVTSLNTYAVPEGYTAADAYLIGTHAYAKLYKGKKAEWRDLGMVAVPQDVHNT